MGRNFDDDPLFPANEVLGQQRTVHQPNKTAIEKGWHIVKIRNKQERMKDGKAQRWQCGGGAAQMEATS